MPAPGRMDLSNATSQRPDRSSQIRELEKLKKSMVGLNKDAKDGFMSRALMRQYLTGLKKSRVELRRVHREYKQINQQVRSIARERKKDFKTQEREEKKSDRRARHRARDARGRFVSTRGDGGGSSRTRDSQGRFLPTRTPGSSSSGGGGGRGGGGGGSSSRTARMAFSQGVGRGGYERWQQFREAPRLGMAGMAGAAAGMISGGGASGFMASVGAGMMAKGGAAGALMGGALMAGGMALGAGKKMTALAVRVGGWAVGQIMEGIPVVIENQMSRMNLERTLGVDTNNKGRMAHFNRGLSRVRRHGFALGYNPAQSAMLAQQTALASGNIRTRDALSNMSMLRGYSLDEGTLFGAHSAARHAGSRQMPGEFNKMMIRGFRSSGAAKPLLREFIQSLTRVMGSMRGTGVKAGRMSAFMGILGKRMGGMYQRSPGLVGDLLSNLHGSIQGPRGEQAQIAQMYAFGYGSKMNLHQYRMAKAKGATPGNIRKHLAYAQKAGGGTVRGMMGYLQDTAGIANDQNYRAMTQLVKAYLQNPDALSSGAISKAMKGKVDIHKQGRHASKRTGMWRTMEGHRQAKGAAAGKHAKNIQDVMALHKMALSTSTDLLNKFTDALRRVIRAANGGKDPSRPPGSATPGHVQGTVPFWDPPPGGAKPGRTNAPKINPNLGASNFLSK